MKQFDASNPACDLVRCAVCEKDIRGGSWFARMKNGGRMVALCSPLCSALFESDPGPFIRRIETLDFESPQSERAEPALHGG